MLPFTFLIFPNSERSPLDRIPWYDLLFFVLTSGSAVVLMAYVRKAAEAGWEFGGARTMVIVAGLVMWVMLMEALRRTAAGVSSAQRFSVHHLSVICRREVAWPVSRHHRRSSRRHHITCSRARACSAFRSRRSRTP